MNLQHLVNEWLMAGADPKAGLRLLMDHARPDPAAARILAKSPERHLQAIKTALIAKAGLPLPAMPPQGQPQAPKNSPTKNGRPALRDQWPFLDHPQCPPELKLLIADKITAYRNCIRQYENIPMATTPDEQLRTARSLVASFIENHNIYKELKHYKETGKTLGEHPIFDQYRQIRELRALSTVDLFKKKKNLEHAIWRNQSKIKNQKRPDLLHARTEKIKNLQMKLAEADRLLQ